MWINLARCAVLFLTAFLVMLSASLTTAFLRTHREYRTHKQSESALRVELANLKSEQSANREYLDLILNDPVFLERVVRSKLGYARPSETIFHFDNGSRR